MSASAVVPLYVLDTNVWLDWLVFSHDAIPLLQTLQAEGEIDIIYTAEMFEELADVLSRAHFKLTPEQQLNALSSMRAAAREVPVKTPMQAVRCADKDDQVFIDTALAYHVQYLLSKDNHLLSLRSRAAKFHVRVATLDAWLAQLPSVLSVLVQSI
ncbi:hypothetical protein DTO96_102498 [Ephemeroptericola cinctiostellae]|uniref:PIN domain-containing protein n=1 Tax=Ephemeroptericola cinctiostellae TaxID=2268024 RepID=A0A345DEF4_9BURK|nr:putative toxin-antitoxin system toxin component, PIN family [Ephemeroptericola cinctiostellae]AXF86742.1 hypothetical protein DTO96_102498 [Ephemeroptericola cinctiostellae]